MTFRILDSQLQALALQTQQSFVAMMAAYLREHFPGWVEELGAGDLVGWLSRALDKAARYGVETEPEAAQFILLLTVLGLDADERHGWVKETLEDPNLAALGKVRKLARAGRAHDRRILDVLVYDGLED
jgi:hypothetical protein